MREMGQSAWLSTSYVTLQGAEWKSQCEREKAGIYKQISWGNNYSVWLVIGGPR